MKEKITGSEALMRSLQAEGVKTIFGYPGGSIMPVYDALYDYTRGEKKAFDHILVRHEQAATHAAEGYARVSGEVGVCIVTSGPGATNTLTGIADAMMDSTPIVVIAGQVSTAVLGTDAFQEVDLVGASQPISKWSYQIRHADDIAWAVSRAFYIARSGRPGPVVLDFPRNAQVGMVEYEHRHVESVRSYVAFPELDDECVRRAAELINNAARPLALVGQGVELANAQEELTTFLEKGDIINSVNFPKTVLPVGNAAQRLAITALKNADFAAQIAKIAKISAMAVQTRGDISYAIVELSAAIDTKAIAIDGLVSVRVL